MGPILQAQTSVSLLLAVGPPGQVLSPSLNFSFVSVICEWQYLYTRRVRVGLFLGKNVQRDLTLHKVPNPGLPHLPSCTQPRSHSLLMPSCVKWEQQGLFFLAGSLRRWGHNANAVFRAVAAAEHAPGVLLSYYHQSWWGSSPEGCPAGHLAWVLAPALPCTSCLPLRYHLASPVVFSSKRAVKSRK